MKEIIGEQKLAIASGVSTNNLYQYDGNVDQILVSTSIETEPYSGVFIPKKLKELILKAHELG